MRKKRTPENSFELNFGTMRCLMGATRLRPRTKTRRSRGALLDGGCRAWIKLEYVKKTKIANMPGLLRGAFLYEWDAFELRGCICYWTDVSWFINFLMRCVGWYQNCVVAAFAIRLVLHYLTSCSQHGFVKFVIFLMDFWRLRS